MHTIQMGGNIEIFLVDGMCTAHITLPDGSITQLPLPDDLHEGLQAQLMRVQGFILKHLKERK